jgi:sugar phosphate isomerase/epimerase
MTSRRTFLHAMGAGLLAPMGVSWLAGRDGLAAQEGPPRFRHALNGTLGLQLYSLRDHLQKDVPGTLATVREWGFREVEVAGLYGLSPADFDRELKKAGLRCVSHHLPYERLRDDTAAALQEARLLGAEYVVCAWIPHQAPFDREDCLRASADFTRWGKAARAQNIVFAYHPHGYEFHESPEGTLLDTMLAETPADLVSYEMDIFWVTHGGGSPVGYLQRYPGRFPLTHLKDLRKGTRTGDLSGQAPDETSVTLGTGMIDISAVLRASAKAGVKWHFIEDEHPDAIRQIPMSLRYLATLRL